MRYYIRSSFFLLFLVVNTISVLGQNNPPVFTSTPIIKISENGRYSYLITASDVDGDPITYSSEDLPSWLNLGFADEGVVSTFAGSVDLSLDGVSNLPSTTQGLAADHLGNIYVIENDRIFRISSGGDVSVFAGSEDPGDADGIGTDARFDVPVDLAIDNSNNIYVADSENNKVRKITPEGLVTTLAGSGNRETIDGLGTDASFDYLRGITVDSDGNVYVSQQYIIRKISPEGAVSTYAGSGQSGYQNGTSLEATFLNIFGLASDQDGNIYAADYNHIRKISVDGIVSSYAGLDFQTGNYDGVGTSASFNGPRDVVADKLGNIYVADLYNHVIRKVDASQSVSTIAGSGNIKHTDGTGTQASFIYPKALAIDEEGNLYVGSSSDRRIRKVEFPIVKLTGNPTGQEGDHLIKLRADDGNNGITNQNFTITVTTPPIFNSLPSASFVENGTDAAYSISATDEDEISYSLGSDIDEAFFDLVGNIVTFKSPPDYETPLDSNNDNIYTIEVIASDGNDESSQIVMINILNLSETGSEFTSTPITLISYTDDYSYEITTSDPDDDLVVISAEDLPSWLTLQYPNEGIITSFAGNGQSGYQEGTGAQAQFYSFDGLDVDQFGNLFVSDGSSRRIRKITPEGVVTTLAGGRHSGYADGAGTNALFDYPTDLAIDKSNNVYVIDDYRIRKISPEGVVSTLAGSGNNETVNGTGTLASFESPQAIAIDKDDNIYIGQLSLIRKITPQGIVTTFAGAEFGYLDGAINDALFYAISGLEFDEEGNLFVVSNFNTLRKISTEGLVTTVAGSESFGNLDGTGTSALFNSLTDLAIDRLGNVFVTDHVNNAIRKVDNDGVVTTFANTVDPNRPAGDAYYSTGLQSLALDRSGNLFVGAGHSFNVLKIERAPAQLVNQSAPPVGDHEVVLTADDGGITSQQNFTITVSETTPPVFTSSPVTSVRENETYSYQITASDIDGDPITFSTTDLPSWLNLGTAEEGVVTTLAGGGTIGTDGTGTEAGFNVISGLTVDHIGNIYFVEKTSNVIRKMTSDGIVSTVAGDRSASGYLDGSGTEARFNTLGDIVVDGSNNLYVTDSENYRIRKITPEGVVSTFAGSGNEESVDGTGTNASFISLNHMAIDSHDNIYVSQKTLIRKISPEGVVTTYAGSSTQQDIDGPIAEATFKDIVAMDFDHEDNLFVLSGMLLRKISVDGIVSTFAGSNVGGDYDGTGTEGRFFSARDIETDALGNIYIAARTTIRKVSTDRVVTTIAGSGVFDIVDGTGSGASFYTAEALTVDQSGNLYVSEVYAGIIRKVEFPIVRLTGDPSGQEGDHLVMLKADDGIGGTANQNFTITVTTPPIFTSLATASFFENETDAAYTITATDEDEITYSLGSENDEGFFDLVGSVITFKSSPDYEMPLDAGNNNSYVIQVLASDGINESSQTVTINILNVSEVGPEFTSTPILEIFENEDYSYAITATDADNDAISFSAESLPSWLTLRYSPRTVSTYAGGGEGVIQEGSALDARFNGVLGLDADSDGNLYIVDTPANKIFKVTQEGIVSTVAGSNNQFYKYRDGTGTDALFSYPSDLALDRANNIYVTDVINRKVRKISPEGIVSTLAGSGEDASLDGTGTSAAFTYLSSIAVDGEDNVYVSETNKIKKITPDGIVTTFLGSEYGYRDGALGEALLANIKGMSFDGYDNLYVISNVNAIRKITADGQVSTIAGSESFGFADGTGTLALFDRPVDLKADREGNVYVADTYNNAIRKIDRNGVVTTVISPVDPDFIEGESAYYGPRALAIDRAGGLYIAESYTNKIYKAETPIVKLVNQENPPVGNHEITLIASDGISENEIQNFTITVDPVEGPAFTSVPITSVNQNGNYSYIISTSGVEGKIVTFSAEELPSWLTLTASQPDVVSTLAGSGSAETMIDGTGAEATFVKSNHLSSDEYGNIYSTDFDLRLVRKITPEGVVTTIAGFDNNFQSVDGKGTSASFSNPSKAIYDQSSGNIYVLDGSMVRKIDPEFNVTLFAGSSSGFAGYVDGQGTSAMFGNLMGGDVDESGNLYVTDVSNSTIRKIDPEGNVTTLAGTGTEGYMDGAGTEAMFNRPWDVAVSPSGNIYISDESNNRIRQILPDGTVSTFAGSGAETYNPGIGENSSLAKPKGIDIDSKGNLYVAEGTSRVVKISPSGEVIALAGTGTNEDTDGVGTEASISEPWGLTVDKNDNIYVSSYFGGRIRKISAVSLTGIANVEPGVYPVSLKAAYSDFGSSTQEFKIVVLSENGPKLTSTTPTDEATEYFGKTISLTFDQNVFKGSGVISVKDADDDSEVWSVGVKHPSISINGATVTFDLKSNLSMNKTYYVSIEPTAFRNSDGLFYGGISDKTTLNFSTKTDLVLISSNPSDGAVEFGNNSITLTFNRDIEKGMSQISIKDASDNMVLWGGGVNHPDISVSGPVLTLNIRRPLPLDKEVYINIDPAAIKDNDGFFYQGILDNSTLNFFSRSTPKLISSSPVDDAMGFRQTTISLTFDRDVFKGNGSISIFDLSNDNLIWGRGVNHPYISIDGATVTIDFKRPLPINKSVYVNIAPTAFRDASGSLFYGIDDKTTLNFTADRVISSSPYPFNISESDRSINQISIGIYPNPASQELTIDLSGAGETPSVSITNMSGQRIFEKSDVSSPKLTVDISQYQPGIFMVTVITKEGVLITEKLSIIR